MVMENAVLIERIQANIRALEVRLELLELDVKWPGANADQVRAKATTWLEPKMLDHLLNLYAKGIFTILCALEKQFVKGARSPEIEASLEDIRFRAQEIADEWWLRAQDEKDNEKRAQAILQSLRSLEGNVRRSEEVWKAGIMRREDPLKVPPPPSQ